MSYCVSPDEIIRLFGLGGTVMFPREAQQDPAELSRSMRILHGVGLPHDGLVPFALGRKKSRPGIRAPRRVPRIHRAPLPR